MTVSFANRSWNRPEAVKAISIFWAESLGRMGRKPELRLGFIQERARTVRDLDL